MRSEKKKKLRDDYEKFAKQGNRTAKENADWWLERVAEAEADAIEERAQKTILKPVYKRVKTVVEHCPRCGKQLLGNNSLAAPWECDCGIWMATGDSVRLGEYEVIPKTNNQAQI